jgi:hypothetical protein
LDNFLPLKTDEIVNYVELKLSKRRRANAETEVKKNKLCMYVTSQWKETEVKFKRSLKIFTSYLTSEYQHKVKFTLEQTMKA